MSYEKALSDLSRGLVTSNMTGNYLCNWDRIFIPKIDSCFDELSFTWVSPFQVNNVIQDVIREEIKHPHIIAQGSLLLNNMNFFISFDGIIVKAGSSFIDSLDMLFQYSMSYFIIFMSSFSFRIKKKLLCLQS